MHDPSSLAWRICFPWYHNGLGMRHWSTFIEVWHLDPETDGTDNSCDHVGWKKQPPPDVERELQSMADWESRYPFYFGNPHCGAGDAAVLLYNFWVAISWRSNYRKPWWKRVLLARHRRKIPSHMWAKAVRYCGSESDNVLSIFRPDEKELIPRELVDKYDGTRRVSKPSLLPEDAYRKFKRCWQFLASECRPWYEAPKWHVHHWQIRIPMIAQLKRWLFTSCCRCGKRFKYGEAPTTNNWNSEGPRWFKGETDMYHSNCQGGQAPTPTRLAEKESAL